MLQKLKEDLAGLPNSLTYPILWAYVQVANRFINASEGTRITYEICNMFVWVWLAWQLRFLRPFMNKYFMHHPLSGRSVTLLTSIFSHHSFIHLLVNSFALLGFGSAATAYLVKRQQENSEGVLESTPRYHFWALFITAGLVSALTSHIASTRIYFPMFLAELRASGAANSLATSVSTAFRRVGGSVVKDKAAGRREILPSLGASGAIYAMVMITALAYPDAQVFLLFPPIPLPISWGVGAMVTMDIVGILRGWRLFDHWAHLGGAGFGVLYYMYGPDIWNALRVIHRRRIQPSQQ
ncbi:uncharacterized protein FOMMEDRAFT_73021 [Fomitiporia mediterranea MF3/22]|uniref:uncharacterized protein n=1 Tax=Fomitiporia mediterranea (strain MF3/22) TaxID=694068 RepID=UPI000440810C|nr:uncharacterized protein FOMMEDRAFT_73021 [Fomitiporia mediterranea MF3/22]EJD07585.1 hypothetical protein FOMMEDRAFT_73021 [Fomitiporia mediterranea MF3/22]